MIWIRLRSSLWFLPALIVIGSIALAFTLIEVDAATDIRRFGLWSRWFGASAEGARGMLTAIATSMITVAGVTFSITIVALAQASNQFTPRILRNFMRDRANQFVLGVFAGIFAYCLVVLRTVRGGEEAFIPSFSINVGLLMALAGVAVLIFFIHHIAMSLQASYIISSVAEETGRVIDELFPEDVGEDPAPATALPAGLKWHPIRSKRSGYIQSIESGAAASAAEEADGVLHVLRKVGVFVEQGAELARLGSNRPLDPKVEQRALRAFDVARHRTIEQDAEFGIVQLVDVAVKALSPAVSDPTTAVTCVNYLGALLAKLVRRRMPASERNVNGIIRVLVPAPRFSDFLDLAFGEVHRNAMDEPRVLLAELQALNAIAGATDRPDRLPALEWHLECIVQAADRHSLKDRELLLVEAARLRGQLSGARTGQLPDQRS